MSAPQASPLLLLPPKSAPPTHRVLGDVRRYFASQVSDQPTARSRWAFYEELDAWLGPWGTDGYPIGYGRRYAKAFTTHRRLRRNATTRAWVFDTAAILQNALLEFVLARMAEGTLSSLTEAELRRAAFRSHAAAYDQAGLARVMLLAPDLVPIIATLPIAEFDPRSENFVPSVDQAMRVAQRVVPKAGLMAAWAAWQLPIVHAMTMARIARRFSPLPCSIP